MTEPPIPTLDLQAQYASIRDEIDAALRRVLASQQFVLGPEVEAFEREFAAYCQSRFAVGCASGSDALLLSLMALGVGPGDEVICPAYTFFATASSIARLGAQPVFADIDPLTYTLDPEDVRRVAGQCKRLKAILPVDLFGQVVDSQAFRSLALELGAILVEDAAQAVGADDSLGRRAGTCGSVGCFSLYPTKNLGAFGDAGVVVTSDADIAQELGLLRVHGARSRYYHDVVGINSRLDALQAAVLRVKLRHLETWTKTRREHAAYYDQWFAGAGAAVPGQALTDARLPLRTPTLRDPGARHVYHQYVVRVPADVRDALRRHLRDCGISTQIYYPLGLHQQACFAALPQSPGGLPHTEAAARETLAIAVYPELTHRQLDRIAESVVSFLTD